MKKSKKKNYETAEECLLRHREAKGVSQLELGRQLGHRSGQFVSNWERGLCPAPVCSYFQLACILDIDFVYLKTIKVNDFARQLDKEAGGKK